VQGRPFFLLVLGCVLAVDLRLKESPPQPVAWNGDVLLALVPLALVNVAAIAVWLQSVG
jgi:hypothetical protein